MAPIRCFGLRSKTNPSYSASPPDSHNRRAFGMGGGSCKRGILSELRAARSISLTSARDGLELIHVMAAHAVTFQVEEGLQAFRLPMST